MERVPSYLEKTLGAFMLWKTLDKVNVWIAPRQVKNVSNFSVQREAEIRNSLRPAQCFDYKEEELAQGFDYKEEDLASEERLWDLYERWGSHHKISRSLTEKQQRFGLFKANLEYIHKVNQMDKPYKLGLNQFSDITQDEFLQNYTMILRTKENVQERLDIEAEIRRLREELIRQAKEKETLV